MRPFALGSRHARSHVGIFQPTGTETNHRTPFRCRISRAFRNVGNGCPIWGGMCFQRHIPMWSSSVRVYMCVLVLSIVPQTNEKKEVCFGWRRHLLFLCRTPYCCVWNTRAPVLCRWRMTSLLLLSPGVVSLRRRRDALRLGLGVHVREQR